ncbi:MAG: PSD1 domain-containing protein [Planctomycetia bacterium]|nr:PSD1 domain-containing protein [Planctomycetia bacterium]
MNLQTLPNLLKGGESGPALKPGDPDQSLLWQQVHGDRMPTGNVKLTATEKALLRDWIAQGAREGVPSAPAAVVVKPSGAKLDAPALARLIDREIQARLDAAKVPASPTADDSEFLRRLYLDLTGTIPPFEKIAPFLDSPDPAKRAKLIDELLASPAYAQHLASLWAARLGDNVPNGPQTDLRSAMGKWLEEAFASNRPWDRMVQEILTATPSDSTAAKKGTPTDSFFSHDSKPATVEKPTNKLAQYFLGIQLQCAQCHNHPFVPTLKQEDYWGLAAFFFKMNGKATEDPKQTEPKAKPDGFQAVPAKFLGGARPALDRQGPARPTLAQWVTAADNPFFAKAMVNRTWAHFFGRGLVNPVDDMRPGQEPTHPVLLEELACQFAANGFDMQYLTRAIANSQTYQRSSKPLAGNAADTLLYSHAVLRSLTPQQLFAARSAIARGQAAPGDSFFRVFDPTIDRDPTVYPFGMLETLRILNAGMVNNTTAAVAKLVAADKTPEQNIEALYLSALARRPAVEESRRAAAFIARKDSTAAAYSDLLWVLLNCAEFQLNH